MRVGWLTDPHLNFISHVGRDRFYATLRERQMDALLISGDVGEANSTEMYLVELENALQIPIYFVLGNHDFYRGSILSMREIISRRVAESRWLHWLTTEGVVSLAPGVALIGHDSWADGRLGNFFDSDVLLNDYVLIDELRGIEKPERFERLNMLGDTAAVYVEQRATEALARHAEVLLVTHVPPFREACWHEGRISDDNWLPHFACKAVGEALVRVMKNHPAQQMTVVCGHTHSQGFARILDNLVVHTGGAVYGQPCLQQIFNFANGLIV